ncbi:MAG TPA: DUF192 domain-containing protein [Thermoanaerobaculia bacterium]|nr:DUF192 domain-containing protein [Thermoanaerobaculia bacterium]
MRSDALCLGVSLLLAIGSCDARQPAARPAPAPQATPQEGPRVILADGATIRVEVASDDATRTQGLMYRDRLPDQTGMIFLFPQSGDYPFWMKNTLIHLDMIWIDDQKRIVHVAHDVPPCKADPCPSYPPNATARYVLEVAAGVAAKHRLADGQLVRFVGLENVPVR